MENEKEFERLLANESRERQPWNKSRIVNNLIDNQKLNRRTARAIASMVEEKIFSMQVSVVPSSLIKQLVLGDTALMMRAERQLQLT